MRLDANRKPNGRLPIHSTAGMPAKKAALHVESRLSKPPCKQVEFPAGA